MADAVGSATQPSLYAPFGTFVMKPKKNIGKNQGKVIAGRRPCIRTIYPWLAVVFAMRSDCESTTLQVAAAVRSRLAGILVRPLPRQTWATEVGRRGETTLSKAVGTAVYPSLVCRASERVDMPATGPNIIVVLTG